MTDSHSNLKIIELPDGSRLVPFTHWIFKIRNSHLTFEKWHHAQYKNKGRQFPIYDCDWESPTSSTELIAPAECNAMWQTVFDYFVRSRQEAGVFEEMLKIVNEDGDVYLNLDDILEFSKASKIGLELLESLDKQIFANEKPINKTASTRHVLEGGTKASSSRSHPTIDFLLSLAEKEPNVDKTKWENVWVAAREIAERESKPAGIIGFCSEGIQYKGFKYDNSGEVDILSRTALQRRFKKKNINAH